MSITINPKQTKTLKDIVKRGGKVNVIDAKFDLRTINALVRRELIKKTEKAKSIFKKTEKAKSIFVMATAKGKKFLN